MDTINGQVILLGILTKADAPKSQVDCRDQFTAQVDPQGYVRDLTEKIFGKHVHDLIEKGFVNFMTKPNSTIVDKLMITLNGRLSLAELKAASRLT